MDRPGVFLWLRGPRSAVPSRAAPGQPRIHLSDPIYRPHRPYSALNPLQRSHMPPVPLPVSRVKSSSRVVCRVESSVEPGRVEPGRLYRAQIWLVHVLGMLSAAMAVDVPLVRTCWHGRTSPKHEGARACLCPRGKCEWLFLRTRTCPFSHNERHSRRVMPPFLAPGYSRP